jgi:hypothetical protein
MKTQDKHEEIQESYKNKPEKLPGIINKEEQIKKNKKMDLPFDQDSKTIKNDEQISSSSPFEKLQDFIDKVDQMKKQDKMDLSSDQDLTIAIMNLISIEEHFFFSGAKTGKAEYYDLIEEVRQIRKDLLKKIIKEYEGEVWCISKHLLASSMRLMECGTKQLSLGHKEQAYNFFEKSYELYCLFWGINLKVIQVDQLKKSEEFQGVVKNTNAESSTPATAFSAVELNNIDFPSSNRSSVKRTSSMKKLGQLVKTIINCCLE